jgi:hypothetical protein
MFALYRAAAPTAERHTGASSATSEERLDRIDSPKLAETQPVVATTEGRQRRGNPAPGCGFFGTLRLSVTDRSRTTSPWPRDGVPILSSGPASGDLGTAVARPVQIWAYTGPPPALGRCLRHPGSRDRGRGFPDGDQRDEAPAIGVLVAGSQPERHAGVAERAGATTGAAPPGYGPVVVRAADVRDWPWSFWSPPRDP